MEVMDVGMKFRPRLVFGYVDSAHAAQCTRLLRRHGWEVHLVASAAEARRLADDLDPQAVVLDADLPDESGWLTCAKITADHPDQKVILLTAAAESADSLDQVGGWAAVPRVDGVDALAHEILGRNYACTL